MFSLEELLSNPSLGEVPYGPGRIARHRQGDLWDIYYDAKARARRFEGTALTHDVPAKQIPGSFDERRARHLAGSH
jgi:hypothetical protein